MAHPEAMKRTVDEERYEVEDHEEHKARCGLDVVGKEAADSIVSGAIRIMAQYGGEYEIELFTGSRYAYVLNGIREHTIRTVFDPQFRVWLLTDRMTRSREPNWQANVWVIEQNLKALVAEHAGDRLHVIVE